MKRGFKRRDWVCRALTDVEDALDALEWCKEYNGHGEFDFQWLLESDILGEFYFENSHDHMMFTLRWVQ